MSVNTYIRAPVSVNMAIKAMYAGNANANQQSIFMQWLVMTACGAGDDTYCESSHDSAFSQGRRWVALQIVKETNINKERQVT